jgi:penicillin amidase
VTRIGVLILLAVAGWPAAMAAERVELVRDRWGIPHLFADTETGAFFGAGYACAEDRLLQMELFRRRARGRLAEIFGRDWVASDRKFRIAGVGPYCDEAAANLPEDLRGYVQAYAAGVNAFARANPERVRRRFAPLGLMPEPWTAGDCVCAWMAVAELFDTLFDESAIRLYREFRELAARLGEEEALRQPGMVIDDWAAVVPEAEMARQAELYARLKATPPTPGFGFRSLPDELLRFSHAWAVSGARSVTGKPLLESDPQTPVNHPPLWYEFHLSGGRFDVRGIGVAGSPALLIGFNRYIAWGASALGAGSVVTFLEKLSPDGAGYLFAGSVEPFEARTEIIEVKDGPPVAIRVRRSRHGFVFDELASLRPEGEAFVSHVRQIEDGQTSLSGLLGMMGAGDWSQFRDAIEWYYSPGLHIVYADVHGNIGYQTLLHLPRTPWTRRMALPGWTGEHEIRGRVPLEELPWMLNPEAGFISHANNLPVGSWYPHDLGIATGGTGHSSRSWRLVQLLSGKDLFSPESFEIRLHRDDVHSAVAALFPIARRLAAEAARGDESLARLLEALRNWDLRYRADQPSYPAAMALAAALLPPYRASPLSRRLGGGEGGITHLARRLADQYGNSPAGPRDAEVRDYLLAWLRAAAQEFASGRGGAPAPRDGVSREIHVMPYQENGPMRLPPLGARLTLESPPLSCGQVGTLWSQKGNSYTQIVDLSDPDNSRAVLPPGISEDPESPHRADQMALWAAGGTRPAPLSRRAVEAIATSRQRLAVEPYDISAPRLLSADGSGRGPAAGHLLRIASDGKQRWEPLAVYDEALGRFVAAPVAIDPEAERCYLVLYGHGLGKRAAAGVVKVYVDDTVLEPLYAGPQGTYPGLDQVNAFLPRSLAGRGEVDVWAGVEGRMSNRVRIRLAGGATTP